MRKSILFSAASILLASTAVAQNGTDTCTTPTAIGEGTFAFDTSGMVENDNLTGCNSNLYASGGLYFNQDMYWVYTATVAGDLTIDTIGSGFDTQLAVHSGIDCAAVCVDNDDDSGGSLTSSLTVVGVSPGDQFVIQVGGYGSNNGVGVLNVSMGTAPPVHPNDDCTMADTITGLGAFAFDTTGATSTGFNGGGGCSTTIGQDIYMQWTAPAAGDFTFDTFGTGFDTKLAVHNGIGCAASCGEYNDDAGGTLQSEVSLSGLAMGDSVLVQVGGYGIEEGPGTLSISQAPDGTDCDLALPISGAGAFAYDTTGAATSGFDGGGTCATGAASIGQDMFFVWTADASGDFQFDTIVSGYDTKMSIHTGSDCTATCTAYDDDVGGSFTSLIVMTGVTVGDTFLVQVGGFGSNEGPGTLTITATVDPCDSMNEDTYEDNDTCATAIGLLAGTYTDLYATDADTDWFLVSVPAGYILTVDLTQLSGDIDFDVMASDCLTSYGAATGSWSLNNTGAVALDVVFNAFNYTGNACSLYDLDIAIVPDPCGPGMDDAFEDNDDCATATPMTDGSTTGLWASDTDNDFYAFCVANGATVNADIFFTAAAGDMDIFLRPADSPGCGGEHGGVDLLAEGWSVSDDETLSWTNDTGADLEVVLQVDIYGTGCNVYDMVLSGTGNCNGVLGTMYCDANANSTGAVASIYGTGDLVAANNNFGLLGFGLPENQFGYFIGSFGQTQVNPAGSDGNLCVGGGLAIARFLPTLGSVFGGQLAGSIDLTNIPLPPTLAEVLIAGDTFNFQLWYRDGSQNNFTPGLEVTFQ